jgi:membrane protein implicated in regulation of membrane protease activity
MIVPSFLLIWPGVAALAVGLALFMFPGMGLAVQAVLFAVLAVAFTLAGRAFVMRRETTAGPDHPTLNRRGARLVGHRGTARGAFVGGRGTVEVEGELWQARSRRGTVLPNGAVEVVGASGLELDVEPR